MISDWRLDGVRAVVTGSSSGLGKAMATSLLEAGAGIGMISVNSRFLQEPLPFFEAPSVKFKNVFDTNVFRYFLVSSVFSELFIEQKKGKFVNISINQQTMTRNGFVPNGPSRAASEAMSYVMVEGLRRYGITVNVLLPGGLVLTGMVPEDIPEERKKGAFNAEIMGLLLFF